MDRLCEPNAKCDDNGLNCREWIGAFIQNCYTTLQVLSSMMLTLPSYPPLRMQPSLLPTQLISLQWMLDTFLTMQPILKSHTPISLSIPPETHIQLFLNAMSYTPSCPVNVMSGLRMEDDNTDPNYLLDGGASISNSYSLSPDADISLGRDGQNLRAQLCLSDLDAIRVTSGVFGVLLPKDKFSLYLSFVHKQTMLLSLLLARSLRFIGLVLTTVISPGWLITCLIFKFGCFLAVSQLNKPFKSLIKQ